MGHPNLRNDLIFKYAFSKLGAANSILWSLLEKTRIGAAATAYR
jgi:hypothetical protein